MTRTQKEEEEEKKKKKIEVNKKTRDKTLLSFTVLVDLKFQGFISGMTS